MVELLIHGQFINMISRPEFWSKSRWMVRLVTVVWPPSTEFGTHTALEATLGQMDGFFSQLPYKCLLEEVASVGD
jgi:hypothetical protein